MPTTLTRTHQLAALIAAEREAADRFRKAEIAVVREMWAHDGIENDAYRAASAEDDAAMRAMVHAQMDVDEALRALSEARDGVVPLA